MFLIGLWLWPICQLHCILLFHITPSRLIIGSTSSSSSSFAFASLSSSTFTTSTSSLLFHYAYYWVELVLFLGILFIGLRNMGTQFTPEKVVFKLFFQSINFFGKLSLGKLVLKGVSFLLCRCEILQSIPP